MKLAHCIRLAAGISASALLLTTARAEKQATTEIVAVFAKTWNGYSRARLPDGSFKPETYAFASAGRVNGNEGDASIDKVTFLQAASVVAKALQPQGYVGAPQGKDADLLIFMSFGTTLGTDANDFHHFSYNAQEGVRSYMIAKNALPPSDVDPHDESGARAMLAAADANMQAALVSNEFENTQRDLNDARNAMILGYGNRMQDAIYLSPFSTEGGDIVSEVEESRYFVVLRAFDFRTLAREHKKKLLWETRFSIARHHNRFDEQLPNMAKFASQFCGEDVGKIIRRHLPNVNVEVGTPRVIETSGTGR